MKDLKSMLCEEWSKELGMLSLIHVEQGLGFLCLVPGGITSRDDLNIHNSKLRLDVRKKAITRAGPKWHGLLWEVLCSSSWRSPSKSWVTTWSHGNGNPFPGTCEDKDGVSPVEEGQSSELEDLGLNSALVTSCLCDLAKVTFLCLKSWAILFIRSLPTLYL